MNILHNTMDAISYSRMMGYSMNDYGIPKGWSKDTNMQPIVNGKHIYIKEF